MRLIKGDNSVIFCAAPLLIAVSASFLEVIS